MTVFTHPLFCPEYSSEVFSIYSDCIHSSTFLSWILEWSVQYLQWLYSLIHSFVLNTRVTCSVSAVTVFTHLLFCPEYSSDVFSICSDCIHSSTLLSWILEWSVQYLQWLSSLLHSFVLNTQVMKSSTSTVTVLSYPLHSLQYPREVFSIYSDCTLSSTVSSCILTGRVQHLQWLYSLIHSLVMNTQGKCSASTVNAFTRPLFIPEYPREVIIIKSDFTLIHFLVLNFQGKCSAWTLNYHSSTL